MSDRDSYGDSHKADSDHDQDQVSPQISEDMSSQKSSVENMEVEEEDGSKADSQQQMDKVQIITEPLFQKSNDKSQRVTPPFLTKYQKARVIGVRAMQISKNSPLYLNAESKDLHNWDPLFIAQKQLSQQKIPFIIRRYLPDSSFEDWHLSELKSLE